MNKLTLKEIYIKNQIEKELKKVSNNLLFEVRKLVEIELKSRVKNG